jgi:hypothetical protein
MKPRSFVVAIIAPGLLAGTLAACSASQEHAGRETGAAHRSSASDSPNGPLRGHGGSGAAGSTGSGPGEMGAGMLSEQAALCELSRRITEARSPQERQFMMDQYLPDLSPEMREWRLQQMREQCRP